MTTVAERLTYLMDRLDMKQTVLAERVGISKQSLYKYLHCKCEPRAEIIAKMATVLNTTADFIVGLTNNPHPNQYNREAEEQASKETELIAKFNKLSIENQIRIRERIEVFLENE